MVIVILGALASIAIPNFSKAKDRAAANQAIAYLRAIRAAEKMYYAHNGEYACAAAGECDNATEIKNVLGIELTTENYAFMVFSGDATHFLASSRKGTSVSGCGQSDTICLDQTGNWSGTSTYRPTGIIG